MTTPQYQSYGGTTVRTETSPASRLDVFKKPLDPELLAKVRKRKVKVLDEDEYVERVEKIIERDFFPELDKLKAQNDYIEAREKNDYATMSRLQEKYSGCRPGTGLGRRLTSPATFETPEEPRRETDPGRPKESEEDAKSVVGDDGEEEEETGKVNLDKFLANHTSEDNESFVELQVEAEKKHRMKNAWMYKDESLYLENKAREMELPSIEQQADPPPRPLEVEGWTYQNINHVFHNPDTLPLSYEEKLELAKKQKTIKHNNTRLSKNPWKQDKQLDALRFEAEKQRGAAIGKVGADGKEIVPSATPMVNGFKMISMAPSPALGVGDSPLMTWGEVESTPFRLEGCETPLPPMAGPGFSIKGVPDRDRIAKELADKNSKFYRDKKQKALAQVKSSMKVGRPNSGRVASGLPHLSPAAKRLVSSKLGIRLGTDDMLRASYTPSPARSKGTPTPRQAKFTPTPTKEKRTPGVKVTPSRSGSRSKGTDKARTTVDGAVPKRPPAPAEETLNLNTDNLLNLGSEARPRAADFMKP